MTATTVATAAGVLRSERLRWRGSAVARIPFAAAAYGLVTSLLFVVSSPDRTWDALIAYQNLWVVFLGPMLTALLVGTLARTETVSAGGGTWSRPVPPRTRRVARFAVLAARSLQANVLVAVPPLAVGVLTIGAPPLRLVAVVAVPWVAGLALVAVLLRVSEHAGRMVVLACGLVWSTAAVLTAESGPWPVLPVTWTLRGSLPVIGTHANGVGLEPGDPLATVSPWPATLLAVLLAAVVVLLPGLRGWRGRATGARHASRPRPRTATGSPAGTARGGPRVLQAVLTVLARTSIPWLALGAVALGMLFLRWRTPDDAGLVLALVIVPVGSVVLAVSIWRALASGWRATAVRATGPGRPVVVAAAVGSAVAVAVVLVTVGTFVAAGMPIGHAVATAVVACAVAAMLTTVSLWLAVRTSAVVAVAVGIAGCVVGVLVGGTPLRDLWWPVVPWSWAAYPDVGRMLVTVPVSLLVTAGAVMLLARAGRSAAVRPTADGG